MTLVVVAALVVRSLWNLEPVDLGYDTENVIALRVTAPSSRYPESHQVQGFFRDALDRIEALPAVRRAGAVHLLPMSFGNWSFPYRAEGMILADRDALPVGNFRIVTPGYFEAMSVPVVDGRLFDWEDGPAGDRVGVINSTFARGLWSNGDAIGKTISIFGSNGPTFRVIGVVGDVKQHHPGEPPRAEMYRPLSQWSNHRMILVVRAGRTEGILGAVESAIRSLDPDAPIGQSGNLGAIVSRTLADTRLVGALLGSFAFVALLIGAVGVYGVVAQAATRRQREFGIRLAVGAQATHVIARSLLDGMVPVVVGIIGGLIGALLLARSLSAVLFEVAATSWGTYVGVALVLTLVALVAGYLPARRAGLVQPVAALREE